MFENHSMPLASTRVFIQRLIYSGILGFLMIILAMAIGMNGYHHLAELSWMDAFLNASMILSGMGPVASLTTEAGKLFAGFYALFSGLAFMVILSVVFAPVVHRLYHKFHINKVSIPIQSTIENDFNKATEGQFGKVSQESV